MVEYNGLPNQCYICRKMGHLVKNCLCFQQKGKEETNNEQLNKEPGKDNQGWKQVYRRKNSICMQGNKVQSANTMSMSNIFDILEQ